PDDGGAPQDPGAARGCRSASAGRQDDWSAGCGPDPSAGRADGRPGGRGPFDRRGPPLVREQIVAASGAGAGVWACAAASAVRRGQALPRKSQTAAQGHLAGPARPPQQALILCPSRVNPASLPGVRGSQPASVPTLRGGWHAASNDTSPCPPSICFRENGAVCQPATGS